MTSSATGLDELLGSSGAAALLDALPDPTAVLSADAVVVAVNRSWRQFTVENGGYLAAAGVGQNYLEICEQAAASGSEDARHAFECVRIVLDGRAPESVYTYDSSAADRVQWFVLRVNELDGASLRGGLVSHLDITARTLSERSAALIAAIDNADRVDWLDSAELELLSKREREVVNRLLRGKRAPAIAAELMISPSTARSQLSSAFTKLGVGSQQELIDLIRSRLHA